MRKGPLFRLAEGIAANPFLKDSLVLHYNNMHEPNVELLDVLIHPQINIVILHVFEFGDTYAVVRGPHLSLWDRVACKFSHKRSWRKASDAYYAAMGWVTERRLEGPVAFSGEGIFAATAHMLANHFGSSEGGRSILCVHNMIPLEPMYAQNAHGIGTILQF